MANWTITKAQIGKEDVKFAVGTFNRTTSTGGTQAVHGFDLIDASQFTGATGTAKQDAAITAIGTSNAPLLATPQLGTGIPTTRPNNVPIFDFRQTEDFLITKSTNADRVSGLLIDSDIGDFTTRALTGTVTLTNGSTSVTGAGTKFTTELVAGSSGSMIKLDADGATTWARISAIGSDTSATLGAVYGGTGGSGAASSTVNVHPLVIRRLVTGGTPPDTGVGEAGMFSTFIHRTAGSRGIYGANFNLTYDTAATTTAGNAIGLEVDITNASGSDDNAATNSLGINVLSAGTKHPGTGIQIISAAAATDWQRGMFIAGFTSGVGLLIQGALDHVHLLPTALNGSAQISGRTVNDGANVWTINNDGTTLFTQLKSSQTYASPTSETIGGIAAAINNETVGANANVTTGLYGQAQIGATNTQNWTSAYAVRGLVGQPQVVTGATGTITGMAAVLANPIVGAATVTNCYGFLALAPTGAGTITNKWAFYGASGAGICEAVDGFKTATAQITTPGTQVNAGTTASGGTVAIPGLLATSAISWSTNAALPATWQTGIQVLLDVSTPGTAKVWLSNPTAGNITPAALVLNIKAII